MERSITATWPAFQDKNLVCKDCSAAFVFTAAEQENFHRKALSNVPKRCPRCRLVYRARSKNHVEPEIFEADCANCGVKTHVPFKPKGIKLVLCAGCMHGVKK